MTNEGETKSKEITRLKSNDQTNAALIAQLSSKLQEEEALRKTETETLENTVAEKDSKLKKAETELAEEKRGRLNINTNLQYDPTPIKPYKSGIIQKDKLKEGYAIKFLSRQGWRNRKKLNRLIENINNIGKDTDKGVRYIFSMTKFAS